MYFSILLVIMNIIINSCLDNKPEGSININNFSDYYLNILGCLDYDNNKPPAADLLRRMHKLDGDWLIVSPINWQATHNDAILVSAGYDFALSEEQGEKLFTKLLEFLQGENIDVFYHNEYTWLIRPNNAPNINARPVYSLLHQSIMPDLESLDKSLFWARFITESQMFFNGNSIHPAINGLWVWGAGRLNARSNAHLLACDADAYQLAQVLTSNVTNVSQINKFVKDGIYLCSSIDCLQNLDDKVVQRLKYWYWNNISYKVSPKNWFTKLIRR